MQHRAPRTFRADTWIGYAPRPDGDLVEDEDRTVPGVFLGSELDEERTRRGLLVVRPSDAEIVAVQQIRPKGVATASSVRSAAARPSYETGTCAVTTYVGADSSPAIFTADMVQELRRRLREAEAREASGVRLRPAPDDDAPDEELAIDIEVELEVEEAERPVLEVALAPNSESNFYAGFDEEQPDGVFVATYSPLAIGEAVQLDVVLPAGHRFRAAAIVEWVRTPEADAPGAPAGVGLRTSRLDESARALVASFVRHRKPLFYVG